MWPSIVTNFFIIKPTRCSNFTNLFWHETLYVSDSSSVHHQKFIHCTLSNGICHTYCSSILVLLESCLQTCMTYTIAELQWINSWWWTDELSETCTVSCQNKFVKLVHLVGFIITKLTFVVKHAERLGDIFQQNRASGQQCCNLQICLLEFERVCVIYELFSHSLRDSWL